MMNNIENIENIELLDIWEYTNDFPIKITRQFNNVNNYNYSFLRQLGVHSCEINPEFQLNGNKYNEPYIWFNVTSPISCYIINTENPDDKEFVENINKDDRFDRWEDFVPFASLNVTFNNNFFKEDNFYFLNNSDTAICKLIKYSPTELTFIDLTTNKTHNITLNYFAPKHSWEESVRCISYRDVPYERYNRYSQILLGILNRIQKANITNILQSKFMPNDDTIQEKVIYQYNNDLCYISKMDIEDSLLYLTTIPTETTIKLSFNELDKLKMVARITDNNCQTNDLTKNINLQKLDYFEYKGTNMLAVIYQDSNDMCKMDICHGIQPTRTLRFNDFDDTTIKPQQLINSYSVQPITYMIGKISQQGFIYDYLFYNYHKTEEDMK